LFVAVILDNLELEEDVKMVKQVCVQTMADARDTLIDNVSRLAIDS
jgi:hypothetical protein